MIDARETARKLILGGVYWSGLAAVSAPLLSGKGAILMLHRVNRMEGSPLGLNSHLSISPNFLDRLLADLKARGVALISLDEMLEHLAGRSTRSAVAITTDDGWLDNLTDALPVFEAHDAPFTIYVAPGLVDGTVVPWWEAVEELAASRDAIDLPTSQGVVSLDCSDELSKKASARWLMNHLTQDVAEEDQQMLLKNIGAAAQHGLSPRRFMNRDEILQLAGHRLATIGAHTVHHYNLKRLSEQAALDEMTASAAMVESQTGQRPRHFAYPYGYESAAGEREVALAAKAGFASAVTTRHGVLHAGHARHPHALPRISVNGNYQRLSYMRAMLSGLPTLLSNGGRKLVTL
jgi:peptidoglycan/xylan/chitin deacetylase (PgdA/CDA1 family)